MHGVVVGVRGQGGKRLRAVAVVREDRVRRVEVVVGMFALDCRDADDLVQPLDRQRPEEEAVDEPEDGGVDADAQRQGQDDRAGQPGLRHQQPEGMAQVRHRQT